ASASTRVMVQDFEKESTSPTVWAVGIPDGNASVERSEIHPHDGKPCLHLRYQFTGGGQYLGISNRVRIQAPIHQVHFWLHGDGLGCGFGLYLADASDETHKFRNPAAVKSTFRGGKTLFTALE